MNIKKYTVAKLREMIAEPPEPSEELMRAMEADGRAGVRRLYSMLQCRKRARRMETDRITNLFKFENDLFLQGLKGVAGVDEAGRGPIAGPVVAAAVILPARYEIGDELSGLDDSKKLTAAKREALAGQIKKVSLAWAIGVSTVSEILSMNIHQASLLAMRRALEGLKLTPVHILVDGRSRVDIQIEQTTLVGGDGLSASIAAASILAKSGRDRLMELCHHLYPRYGFDRHKGYPTGEHLHKLNKYGPCPLHRTGFAPVKELLNKNNRTIN